jgi:hypothetical protein
VKKEVFEPAKVVGNVDPKKDQKIQGPGETRDVKEQEVDATAADAQREKPAAAIPQVDALVRQLADKPGEEPFGETLDRYAAEEKLRRKVNDGVPALAEGPEKPTLDEEAAFIRGIVAKTVAGAMDQVGIYLLQHEFGGDIKKALSKNRYKGTSLNDLASHEDQPLSRQTLTDCILGAAVGTEMERDMGLERDAIHFFTRAAMARVDDREKRQDLIRKTVAEKLTVKAVRNEVKKLTGKEIPTDKGLGDSVLKQLAGGRLSDDQETRDFLLDKGRLKKALSAGEMAKLLAGSEDFRAKSSQDQLFLQHCEVIVAEAFVEKRQEEGQPEKAQTTH